MADLFNPNYEVKTLVIKKAKDSNNTKEFRNLFKNFSEFYGIIYLIKPIEIIDLFEKENYKNVEIIIDGFTSLKKYEEDLSQKSITEIEKIVEFIKNDRLKIFFPTDRMEHSKYYFLKNEKFTRVINGSANYTFPREPQQNYVWFIDFPNNAPELEKFKNDYRKLKENTKICLQSLLDMFKENDEDSEKKDTSEIIKIWIGNIKETVDYTSEKNPVEEILPQIIRNTGQTIVQIPTDMAIKLKDERLFKDTFSEEGSKSFVRRIELIDRIKTEIKIPIMFVDMDKECVFCDKDEKRTESNFDKEKINNYLKNVEDYIGTVDLGVTSNKVFVKQSICEALLYVLSTLFVNEITKMKREHAGLVNRRGIPFLFIYGDSKNGKTTFLKFVSKIIYEQIVQPIEGNEFNKARVNYLRSFSSCFPLFFDDIGNRWGYTEQIIKSHWEVNWNNEKIFPQLILTSNKPNLPDWAETRVKKINFDIKFSGNPKEERELNEILKQENLMFRYFSFLFIKELKKREFLNSSDHLWLARRIFKKLYKDGEREIPDYLSKILDKPIEEIYDINKKEWQEIIFRYQKVKIKEERADVRIDFSQDMTPNEIKTYINHLPSDIKHKIKGKTLILEEENGKKFLNWIEHIEHKNKFLRFFTHK